MARWERVERDAPEFAAVVRRLFAARKHMTLATLRRDGSPRISGTEAEFRDGDLWLGSMWLARKAVDLRRDARMALHSPSVDPAEDDPSAWSGEAKLSGRVEEVPQPAEQSGEPSHLFRVDVDEVVWTRVGTPADYLVIELWRAGEGLRRFTRH